MKKPPAVYFEEQPALFLRGTRDWSIDILRCVSCFMVCALHAAIFAYRYQAPGVSDPPTFYLVYRMIFGSPTILFVMISGIFFLSPDRNITITRIWRKNVMKMAAAYIIWSLIYALYRILFESIASEISPKTIIHQ